MKLLCLDVFICLLLLFFLRLPQDLYQIAKVWKILQLIEKGEACSFKNKTLDEIDIDMESIEADEAEVTHINEEITTANPETITNMNQETNENECC